MLAFICLLVPITDKVSEAHIGVYTGTQGLISKHQQTWQAKACPCASTHLGTQGQCMEVWVQEQPGRRPFPVTVHACHPLCGCVRYDLTKEIHPLYHQTAMQCSLVTRPDLTSSQCTSKAADAWQPKLASCAPPFPHASFMRGVRALESWG